MSEITKVEMIHGLENPKLDEKKLAKVKAWDEQKLDLTKQMGVRWLSYPCSRFDDTYSRWDTSFRFAGPKWEVAMSLEKSLEEVPGISVGDARQLVSCCYGSDTENLEYSPAIKYFTTEDGDLRSAVKRLREDGGVQELATVATVSTAQLLAEIPE